ncbi:MAG: hypothetical protein ACRDSR_10970 [Pseudonocardiaceae bacterium]
MAIIGSGLAMAIQPQRHGNTDSVVLERADDVGGAWRNVAKSGVSD